MFKKLLPLILLIGPALGTAATTTSGNYYYQWDDWSLSGKRYARSTYYCPSAYPRVVSGICGHRDYNSAQQDITVNYSGPAPGSETTSWRCLVENNSSASRAIRDGIICSK